MSYFFLFATVVCGLRKQKKTAWQWAPQTPGKKQLEHTKSTAKSPWDSKMVRHCPIRRLMNYRAFPVDQFLLGPVLFDLLIGSHILQVVSFDFTCALAHLGSKMKVLEMNRCFDSVGGGLKLFRPYCVQIPAKNT